MFDQTYKTGCFDYGLAMISLKLQFHNVRVHVDN